MRAVADAGERDPAGIRRMAGAYRLSAAVAAFAELGVADLLVEGPRSAAEIAAALGVHQPTLHRLLRALAGEGVVSDGGGGERHESSSMAWSIRSSPRMAREDRRQGVPPKSTSLVSTVPAVRPGAVWYFQYRLVCAMTWSGGGAPHADWSSVVCASLTSVAS